MQLFNYVAHQAASAHQVTAELFDELLEARLALRSGCVLMGFRNRCADRQEIADEQRQVVGCRLLFGLVLGDLG